MELSPPTAPPRGALREIALDALDPQDTTWRFRATLDVSDLAASLEAEGQETPVAVRLLPDGRLQLVSGFRRVAAARALGWATLVAVVREDLDTDEAAFRAAVAENIGRRSYSDIDRALVAQRALALGQTLAEVATLLGLGARQVRNLTALLRLPPEAQAALADPDSGFTAAHALTLRKHEAALAEAADGSDAADDDEDDEDDAPSLDWAAWIATTAAEGLSVAQLRRRLGAEVRPAALALVDPRATVWEDGVVRLRGQRLDVAELRPEDRAQLRRELERLLALLADP